MKHLTKVSDLNVEQATHLVESAFAYKHKFDLGIRKENVLGGKMVAMVFEKPSLRTKVAFEIATEYLGGTAVYLSQSQILASGNNVKGRESVPDIARNLERFSDLILARVYEHSTIADIVEHVAKPVINALCDQHHPTQALADIMTMQWHKGPDTKLKVVFIGDGNNVAVSLMEICVLFGHEFVFCGPGGYQIPADLVQGVKGPGSVTVMNDPESAVVDADCVYTDTFVSMGQEEEQTKRLQAFAGYQVDVKLFKAAKPDAIFMHCLPAHRGEEVTDEVMDHERSVVFDQAECRMHVAKALLAGFLSQ